MGKQLQKPVEISPLARVRASFIDSEDEAVG
jgi:hypothetical protein